MSSDPYGGQVPYDLIAAAGNVVAGGNPTYDITDFCGEASTPSGDFPQFNALMSDGILNQFIGMASASILQGRWHESWHYAMSLFVAHFATLYLQTVGKGATSTAKQVIGAAQARGLQTSKSAGGLSVGYDYSMITSDLSGWGNFKATSYGIQLASLGEIIGSAGMWIY